jgi:hypothetical protein
MTTAQREAAEQALGLHVDPQLARLAIGVQDRLGSVDVEDLVAEPDGDNVILTGVLPGTGAFRLVVTDPAATTG